MPYIKYCIILICSLLLIYTIVRTLRISHAFRLQQMLAYDASGCCFSLGFVGCSVLCRNIRRLQDINTLLHSEYDRYEIILVMDENLQPELFHDIIKQFKMVRVTPPDLSDIPHSPIRLLYRSRQRCFRRLILLDKGSTTPYDDMNAAAAVASFDYLFPLSSNIALRHRAMENVAMILASHADVESHLDLIRSTADNSLIFNRNAVVGAGGFSPRIVKEMPRKNIFEIHIPLLEYNTTTPFKSHLTNALVTCVATLAALFFVDSATALAIVATMLTMGCSAHYLTELFDNKCSLRAIICQISHMRFFFYARKFFL